MKKMNLNDIKDKDNNKYYFNIPEVVAIVFITLVFGFFIGTFLISTNQKKVTDSNSKELNEFISTYNSITNNYYGKIDKQKLINEAIKGMVSSLGDDYSVYMDNDETDAFNTSVDGSYKGIGAVVSNVDGKNVITEVFDNTPAKSSGLKAGDIFSKINGKDVSSLDLESLTNLIKGKENTSVKITIIRNDKEKTFNVVRGNVDIPTVYSKVFEVNNKKIGYLSLSVFTANSYDQFKNNLNKIEKKKIDSLVIDLRSNPGGHLSEVSKMLSLFLPKTKILYQLESKGVKTPTYSYTKEKRDYKVAVLINGESASASEVMTACFKESYDNAVIVGEKSFGKGTVQNAFTLPDGSCYKFTTQKWLTPKGNWINKKGIMPDYEVSLDDNYKNNPSYENDNQLQKALEVLSK